MNVFNHTPEESQRLAECVDEIVTLARLEGPEAVQLSAAHAFVQLLMFVRETQQTRQSRKLEFTVTNGRLVRTRFLDHQGREVDPVT